jgi:Flp pilus assembly protein TadD
MPELLSKDVSHTESTDHRILRRPAAMPATHANSQFGDLQPFPLSAETKNDVRDLALAYEGLVERGNKAASERAERLLELADSQDPNDAPVLTALGYIAQERGDIAAARQYYERALRSDSTAQEAATNLGVIEAKEGHLRRAVSLWQMVFKEAPWRSTVGVDIALGYCAADRYDEARIYAKRVLEFNPDFAVGRSLLAQLSANPPTCSLGR